MLREVGSPLLVSVLALFLATSAWAEPTLPELAPPPRVLIAEVDDSDLDQEEGLTELIEDEYDQEAWSVSAAVGLSLVPGGGLGLVYAEKKAQAMIPILLSAVGYGIGVAYLAGAFDESSKLACKHTRDGTVPLEECSIANDPIDNKLTDPRSEGQPYWKTAADYEKVTVGEDFDGVETGILVLGATYAVTTVLGAIWATATVMDHNDQLRKDIESTASLRPFFGFDQEQGVVGFALDF